MLPDKDATTHGEAVNGAGNEQIWIANLKNRLFRAFQ